jgi:hypothetical protein
MMMTFMIDLWTTRCTRCPAALDTLNQFATEMTKHDDNSESSSARIQCVSICCGDTLDGAREIIEATKLPRWGAIQHYFMAYNDKERCKQLLNFRQVPFYIVFHSSGKLLFSGNQKMDWLTLFHEDANRRNPKRQIHTFETKQTKIPDILIHSPTSATIAPATQDQQTHGEEIAAFVIDDMDF